MASRPRHNCNDVEKVLKRLEKMGWVIVYPSGHWGRAECPDGCRFAVGGTPKSCGNLAKRVQRTAQKCPHGHRPS